MLKKRKKVSLFDILFNIRFDKKFWKSFLYEISYAILFLILLAVFLKLVSSTFYPLNQLYDPAVIENPLVMLDFSESFDFIIAKLVLFTLIFFSSCLYLFSYFKFKQYSLYLTKKQVKNNFKPFLAINFIAWIFYILFISMILVLMMASYFNITKGQIFVYMNLFFFLVGIAGMMILMLVKTFFVMNWFIKHTKKIEKCLFYSKFFVRAFAYLFVVFVLYIILSVIITLLTGPASLLLLVILFFILTNFTKILFIEMIENG